MKGYYLYEHSDSRAQGIIDKMQKQCNCFADNQVPCKLICMNQKGGLLYKFFRRFVGFTDNIEWPQISEINDADFLYIRKTIITNCFFRFVSRIRKNNPKIIIFVEIPTFPYDDEFLSTGFANRILLYRDWIGRFFVKRYVDYFAVMGDCDDVLWGVPVLHIANGINLSEVQLRIPDFSDNVIRVLCVANFSRYHGVDLFMLGMVQYYSNGGDRDIELHLVGKGNQYNELLAIKNSNDCLKNRVFFYGILDGQSKIELYNKCDIGIVSLGYERINLRINTTIKSKEYMAVGLPFICDTEIDILRGKKVGYFLHTHYGINPTNINDIINFYDKLYGNCSIDNKEKLSRQIRVDAERFADINATMAPVVNTLFDVRAKTG